MITKINNKKTYERAVERIYNLMQMQLSPEDQEYDELNILSLLVDEYEKEKFVILPPDPIEAIKFRMEQLGIDSKELEKILGSKSRVSEVLNKKRKLSIRMIRSLNKRLNIPAQILLAEY